MLFRIEKDKGKIMAEVADVRAATDEVNRSKVMNIICPKENDLKNLLVNSKS